MNKSTNNAQQENQSKSNENALRVLVVTNMYPTKRSPYNGTFVKEQVEALRKLGADIDVLFVDGQASKWNYIIGIARYWRRILSRKYDLVHAHYVYSGLIARMQIGIPVLVSSHGSDSKKRHEAWLLRKLVRCVSALTVTSREHQSRPGMKNGRIIPCGVNTDVFFPRPQADARKDLGWNLDQKVILYVGRNSPEKRLDIIRSAFDILHSSCNNVRLELAIGIKHDLIPTYMNAADVLVLASDYEGAPVVIKEAMACNLPIVSVDVGDVRDIIRDTEGCYISERTPIAVAASLEKALAFGKRTNGREVAECFSTASEAKQIMQIYKSIVKNC